MYCVGRASVLWKVSVGKYRNDYEGHYSDSRASAGTRTGTGPFIRDSHGRLGGHVTCPCSPVTERSSGEVRESNRAQASDPSTPLSYMYSLGISPTHPLESKWLGPKHGFFSPVAPFVAQSLDNQDVNCLAEW